ncbi:hypothetical protein [Mesorhizobium sp. CN2-181]|uniref:hypothetical protein n=1 Tax=Mesorhizobium yinganensis TaxID=3157707 RepID=UPI0032B79838
MSAASGTVSRDFIKRPAFVAVATAVALIAVGLLDITRLHLSRWLRTYSEADLVAARVYVDALPASAAPTLFATDLRTFHSYGERDLAKRGIKDFRARPADESWPFPGRGENIDVVVLPGFSNASAAERREIMAGADVPPRTLAALSGLTRPEDGCHAGKNAPFGWNDDGTVLADPVILMTDQEVRRCLFAGLAFVSGFPMRDDRFNFVEVPSTAAIEIILDYIMRCARDGITQEQPAQRSRTGITTRPSISCVRDRVDATINDLHG